MADQAPGGVREPRVVVVVLVCALAGELRHPYEVVDHSEEGIRRYVIHLRLGAKPKARVNGGARVLTSLIGMRRVVHHLQRLQEGCHLRRYQGDEMFDRRHTR